MTPSNQPERRALVIVAKYPRSGAVKTRLAAALGVGGAATLYRAFLLDLAARFTPAAARDGYALVWAHTPDPGDLRAVVGVEAQLLAQRGAELGERLYHIGQDLAARGCTDVVIVSSDAPHLPASAVRDAFRALEHAATPSVALAPSEDGGYSLVGLRATPAAPDLFRGIEMSTPQVYAQTLERAAALGLAVIALPVIFDVDGPSDLRRLAAALATVPEDTSAETAEPGGTIIAAAPHTQAALAALGIIPGGPILELRPLDVTLGSAYLDMVDECVAVGEGYPYNNIELARADFAAFARELDEEARGIGLPPEIAPQQTFVLVEDGQRVVGEIRFRPTITPPYEAQNGHIGYNVCPSARGKGYATRQLALVLDRARQVGLPGVLLPVEGANPASVQVITKNGGTLERTFTDPESGTPVRCFWIALDCV
ncbi:MAG TPA: TIGR04282 family arsenosugar biosynthesis glycosyltransferase [Ktedonobacterales bacterium]